MKSRGFTNICSVIPASVLSCWQLQSMGKPIINPHACLIYEGQITSAFLVHTRQETTEQRQHPPDFSKVLV